MNISDRLILFIEYKGITKNKFYKKTGLSNGFLDKKPNIGADKIEIIHSTFPEINLYWLITGVGEMTKNMNNIKGNSLGDNNKIHIANGDIKNAGNKYISESSDMLKKEIQQLNKLLEEKELRIKEKDSQIKEKDSQIKDLLQILKQK